MLAVPKVHHLSFYQDIGGEGKDDRQNVSRPNKNDRYNKGTVDKEFLEDVPTVLQLYSEVLFVRRNNRKPIVYHYFLFGFIYIKIWFSICIREITICINEGTIPSNTW